MKTQNTNEVPSHVNQQISNHLKIVKKLESLVGGVKELLEKREQSKEERDESSEQEDDIESEPEQEAVVEENEENVCEEDEESYCVCGAGYGKMFECSGLKCERQWFHPECLDMKAIPKGTWFCDMCRKKDKDVLKSKRIKSKN